jgi:hypothetical protein
VQIDRIAHEHGVGPGEKILALMFTASSIVMGIQHVPDRVMAVAAIKQRMPSIVRESVTAARKYEEEGRLSGRGGHTGEMDPDRTQKIEDMVWPVVCDAFHGEALQALMYSLGNMTINAGCADCRKRTAEIVSERFPEMLNQALDQAAFEDPPAADDPIH